MTGDGMAEAQAARAGENGFRTLLEFSLDAKALDGRWDYCDFMSNFVARMVSHTRADPFLYGNLLSATLNELFETIYRMRREIGLFKFRILRKGSTDRIAMTVPCEREEREFLESTAQEVQAAGNSTEFLSLLHAKDEFDRRVGLFELAVNYGARISVEALEENLVRLTVDLNLEEAPN